MAALSTKLTLTKNSTTESITSYSVKDEGTVQTAFSGTTNQGTFWQINNNGTTAYIGLWPTSITSGGNPNHSMLKITKSGTEYWVEKTVNNNFTLTLAATTNQTITLKYTQPGASEVTKTSTSSAQNFTVQVGTTWTATIAGSTGYTPGALSPGSSGTVRAATTVTAAAATPITPKITISITNSDPATEFTVTYTNTSGTFTTTGNRPTSVTIKYNTTITFICNGSTTGGEEAIVKCMHVQNSSGTVLASLGGNDSYYYEKRTYTTGKLTNNTTYKVTGFTSY